MVLKESKIYSLLILASFSLSISFAKTTSIRKLKDDLNQKNGEITKIGATIRTLEKRLGETNETFIEKNKELKKLDTQIAILKKELSASALEISKSYKTSKKILNHYLLDKIDDQSRDKQLKRKVYLKLLSKKISSLKKAQLSSQNLLNLINEYEDNLKQTKQNEESLYQLIVDLENQKKSLGQTYITKMEDKNELEEALETALARQRVKKPKKYKKVAHSNINIELGNPIANYISLKGSKKGVTYKYNKVSPVHSTQSGQVVYAGELASYGKVIMIDHGHEIRSVILGDISIKVKKGDVISKGGIVAYTNVDPGLTKSLYYEVRKRNIAQNTLSLLSKKTKNI